MTPRVAPGVSSTPTSSEPVESFKWHQAEEMLSSLAGRGTPTGKRSCFSQDYAMRGGGKGGGRWGSRVRRGVDGEDRGWWKGDTSNLLAGQPLLGAGHSLLLQVAFPTCREPLDKLTRMIPAWAVANCIRVHSYLLGPHIPSRSPFFKPRARSPAAACSTWSMQKKCSLSN